MAPLSTRSSQLNSSKTDSRLTSRLSLTQQQLAGLGALPPNETWLSVHGCRITGGKGAEVQFGRDLTIYVSLGLIIRRGSAGGEGKAKCVWNIFPDVAAVGSGCYSVIIKQD